MYSLGLGIGLETRCLNKFKRPNWKYLELNAWGFFVIVVGLFVFS
jgi:hypothetical protein